MGKYKIAYDDGTAQEVYGEIIYINGVKCFTHSDNEGLKISHFDTGMQMGISELWYEDNAVKKVIQVMSEKPNWLKEGMKRFKKNGFKFPLNKNNQP